MIKYNTEFFNNQTQGSLASAKAIIPIIMKIFSPKSVVDVGCGTGSWLSVFKKVGVKDILGIDGDYVKSEQLLISKDEFISKDLNRNFSIKKKYDVLLTVEVAEHIEPENAEVFINNLTKLSDIIIFSAAIPHQSGTHHVNEQWPNYWEEIFNRKDYIAVDYFRKRLWSNNDIRWWYRQNLLIFIKKNKIKKYPVLATDISKDKLMSLVHPDNYISTKENQITYKVKKILKLA